MAEKIGEVSVGVEPQTKAQLEALARALAELTKKSEEAEKKSSGLGEALTKVGNAARGAQALASGGLALAQQLVETAVSGERTERAMAALGDSYDLVRRATNETVGAQDAYRARLTLTNSGLRISGQELATVARYAREHRQATESSAEALQRLTESLREGEQGGLRQFGIAVDQGVSRARTFEHALRQMQRANEEGSPAARTLAEEVERVGSSFGDALGALASWTTRATGLQGILAQIATSFHQIATDARDLQQLNEDLPAQQRTQAQRQAAMERYRAAQSEASGAASALGLDMPQVSLAGLTPAQIDATAARLRAASAAAGGTGPASAEGLGRAVNRTFNDAGDLLNRRGSGGPDPFAGAAEGAEAASTRTLAALRPGARAAAQRLLQAELARIARDAGAMSSAATPTPEAEGPRDSAQGLPTGPTYGERQQLRRAAEEVFRQQVADEQKAREAASAAQIDTNRLAQSDEDKGRRAAAEAMRDRLRQEAEDEGKARRAAAEAEQDARTRDSDLRVMLFERETNAAQTMRDGIVSAYDDITKAGGEWLVQLVEGVDGASAAFATLAGNRLRAISIESAGQALQATAEGIYYSFTAPPIAATKFLAALKFGALAAGAGLAGYGVASLGASGGAGGSSGGSTPRSAASLLPGGPTTSSTTPTSTVINYYAPVVGGRESTDAEAGTRLRRYDRAAEARLTRPRAA